MISRQLGTVFEIKYPILTAAVELFFFFFLKKLTNYNFVTDFFLNTIFEYHISLGDCFDSDTAV